VRWNCSRIVIEVYGEPAATAVGAMGLRTAIDPLIDFDARIADPAVRRASLDSLRWSS